MNAGTPSDSEILANTITDPVISHVDGLGPLGFAGVGRDSLSCEVVCGDGRERLDVVEVIEGITVS
jgi:hypothetical protein